MTREELLEGTKLKDTLTEIMKGLEKQQYMKDCEKIFNTAGLGLNFILDK